MRTSTNLGRGGALWLLRGLIAGLTVLGLGGQSVLASADGDDGCPNPTVTDTTYVSEVACQRELPLPPGSISPQMEYGPKLPDGSCPSGWSPTPSNGLLDAACSLATNTVSGLRAISFLQCSSNCKPEGSVFHMETDDRTSCKVTKELNCVPKKKDTTHDDDD